MNFIEVVAGVILSLLVLTSCGTSKARRRRR